MKISAFVAFAAVLLACAAAFGSGDAPPLPEVRLSALFEQEESPAGRSEEGRQEPYGPSRRFGLPGWWGFETTERSRSAVFLPFYYRHEESELSIRHYWPLYGRKTKKDQYDTRYCLWPFLRYTRYDSGATQLDFPWPFVHFYGGFKEFRVRLFPLLWVNMKGNDEGSVVLFPAFWHLVSDKSRATVFFPVYWDAKTPESELWHVWPLYGYSKRAGRRRVMLGFPLLRYTRRWDPQKAIDDQPADRQVDLLWPLMKLRLGPMHRQFHLFPFFYGKTYYRDKEDGRTKLHARYFCVLPAFWYYSNPIATYFHLWPFGLSKTRDNDERRLDLAWPLLSIHTIKKSGVLEISVPFYLSLFKYKSVRTEIDPKKPEAGARYTAVRLFPVFNYRSGPARNVFGDARLKGKGVHWSIFPLVRYRSLESSEGVEISGPAIFPIFNYTSKAVVVRFADQSTRGRSVSMHLFPLVAYRSTPALFQLTVNPLFSYRCALTVEQERKVRLYGVAGLLFSYTSDLEGYDFRILTGLFGFGRKHEDSYIRLFWGLKL